MVQYISPVNKSGPQDIFSLWIKEDGFKYAHNKSCVIYSSQEVSYPSGEENPSTFLVGDIGL